MPYLLSDNNVAEVERAICNQAEKVCSYVALRKDRPSYGYTKTMIRHEGAVLDGMIGLFQIITGQANHPAVPNQAQFMHLEVAERVKTARQLVREL